MPGGPHGAEALRDEETLTERSKVVDDSLAETDAAARGLGDGGAGGEDWWCVKAAGGNGGLAIWVLHEGNWKAVTDALSENESYVVQVRMGVGESFSVQGWFVGMYKASLSMSVLVVRSSYIGFASA